MNDLLAATATIDRSLRLLPGGPETTALRERARTPARPSVRAPITFLTSESARCGTASGDRHSLDANQKQLSALKTAHESLLLTLTPMIDDAAFDLVLTTEKVTTNNRKELTEFIDVSADVLQLLLTLRAEGNLAVSLLEQAASTSNVNLARAFKRAVHRGQGTHRANSATVAAVAGRCADAKGRINVH